MPSYLIASVPIHGHVTPLLPIAAHLVARGDSVRFLTGARFAGRVAATGATHVPLPEAADFDDRAVDLDARAHLSPAAAIAYDLEHVFIRPAAARRPTRPAPHRCPDRDHGSDLPPARGRRCRDLPPDPRAGRQRAGADLAVTGRRGHPAVVAGLRVPTTAGDDPARVHRNGHDLLEPRAPAPRVVVRSERVAARRARHSGDDRNDDLSELIRPTVEALAGREVLVVVATGGRPVADLGELPINARAAEFQPYEELFARTDVFVTNGGYGGVQFALAHGVPVVVAPGKEDKVEVAARVGWSGTGVNLRKQRPTRQQIRRAVDRVVTEQRFRTAAARIATEMAQASGAAGFASVVDDVVATWPPAPRPLTRATLVQRSVA